MSPRDHVVTGLADALLAGPVTPEALLERAAAAFGRKHRWLAGFCRRVFVRFGSRLGDRDRAVLLAHIKDDPGFNAAWISATRPRIRKYFLEPPRVEPPPGALAACGLPALATPGELAAWLGLEGQALHWLADPLAIAIEGSLCHYTYRWLPKRRGGHRLMEVPKSRLRELQRKLLSEVLGKVPVHQAAHGFTRGRSCLTHAREHIGRQVVLRMDLRNFFGTIPASRVHALWMTLGYPQAVARLLTGLSTHRVPMGVSRGLSGEDPDHPVPWSERKALEVPHLPQGAPTSPALANLCALHLDLRLAALARAAGATYTRYADDLTFSGDEPFRRSLASFRDWVAAIAIEEGFQVNHRKTRVMHEAQRQRVTGVVVNRRLNVERGYYERLKATLHNCARGDPLAQNREGHPDFRAHLRGRIAHVASLNPSRGEKLRRAFERIAWPE